MDFFMTHVNLCSSSQPFPPWFWAMIILIYVSKPFLNHFFSNTDLMFCLKARSHGTIFCECDCDKKMGCVDVNETVHMVQLQCICVCNVAHEWVPYPFRAIVMSDSSMYL